MPLPRFPLSQELRMALPRPHEGMKITYFPGNDGGLESKPPKMERYHIRSRVLPSLRPPSIMRGA